MEIYSLSFFLLVSVGLILYYTVFSRCQWICLLGLSLLFFTASGWKGLVFLLFTALTIWLGGLQLAKLDADSAARRKAPGITKDEKKAIKAQAVRRKKCLVAAVLTANFLVLGYFKYWSYFAELLSGAFFLRLLKKYRTSTRISRSSVRKRWKNCVISLSNFGISDASI